MTEALSRAVDALRRLRAPERKSSFVHAEFAEEQIREAKAKAVEREDQVEASLFWQAETILTIQRGFIEAFDLLKKQEFYQAWCQLERCEIEIAALRRHYAQNDSDLHRIAYIESMVERWQRLYPYKMFFSPEILKKKIACSICGATVSPRSNCGHMKFEIYNGEMCYHKVEELEFLSISAVETPVQKYSVAFLADEETGDRRDHYDYGNVRFVVERVASPFHGWTPEATTRNLTASELAHVSADRPCPCMSGKQFGDCCSGKAVITIPHLQIHFYVPPNKELPENELLL